MTTKILKGDTSKEITIALAGGHDYAGGAYVMPPGGLRLSVRDHGDDVGD